MTWRWLMVLVQAGCLAGTVAYAESARQSRLETWRNLNRSAFLMGRTAAMMGSGVESCPFTHDEMRQSWMVGWRVESGNLGGE